MDGYVIVVMNHNSSSLILEVMKTWVFWPKISLQNHPHDIFLGDGNVLHNRTQFPADFLCLMHEIYYRFSLYIIYEFSHYILLCMMRFLIDFFHGAQVPDQLSHGAWSFFMRGIRFPHPLANIMVLTYVIK